MFICCPMYHISYLSYWLSHHMSIQTSMIQWFSLLLSLALCCIQGFYLLQAATAAAARCEDAGCHWGAGAGPADVIWGWGFFHGDSYRALMVFDKSYSIP